MKDQKYRSLLQKIIKSTYNIQDLSITLENPVIFNNISDIKYENLMFSRLTLEYGSYTDIDSIKFMNALAFEIPGMIIYKEIYMDAPKAIIPAINIAFSRSGISEYKNFVKNKVVLLWIDLDDKKKSNSNNNT